eukprot:IDg6351t1
MRGRDVFGVVWLLDDRIGAAFLSVSETAGTGTGAGAASINSMSHTSNKGMSSFACSTVSYSALYCTAAAQRYPIGAAHMY